MSSKIHSVDVEKDAFSNAIPEIEVLKRRKKEEIEKQQVLEIQELEKKKTYAQAAESAVSKSAVSKPAQNSEKTEKNTAHVSIHRKVKKKFFSQLMTDIEVQKSVIASIKLSFFRNFIILTTMSEFKTQNVHSVSEIIKLVSINVKHAQKEMKFVNILCLSALIAKKNMHLAQKNVCLLLELKRTGEKMKLK
ncbi:hypothetical protein BDDG_13706, partial [Blastomyces dermatitidis ATCC 18188]